MATYVFRWETPNGDGPRTGCVVNNNKMGNYRYVFTTMKSALMWIRELAWGYDNPTHSDLVLCIYEADECYPVCVDIGTHDNPHPCFCNGIDAYCSEFIARVWNRVPIAYMTYDELKSYGRLINQAYKKSRKAIVELLQLKSRDELFCDDAIFSSDWSGTCWYYWQNDGANYELVTK